MISINNVEELQNYVEEFTDGLLQDMNVKVMAKEQRETCGLDPRALPTRVWYNDDFMIVPSGLRKVLDYYGGFEYVEPENVYTVGDLTFYSGECERVRRVLDALNGVEGEEE